MLEQKHAEHIKLIEQIDTLKNVVKEKNSTIQQKITEFTTLTQLMDTTTKKLEESRIYICSI